MNPSTINWTLSLRQVGKDGKRDWEFPVAVNIDGLKAWAASEGVEADFENGEIDSKNARSWQKLISERAQDRAMGLACETSGYIGPFKFITCNLVRDLHATPRKSWGDHWFHFGKPKCEFTPFYVDLDGDDSDL